VMMCVCVFLVVAAMVFHTGEVREEFSRSDHLFCDPNLQAG
jgi:hypothetical protein